jgi:hypothetical protein
MEETTLEHNNDGFEEGRVEGFGLDSTQGPVADNYEHSNEPSGPINGEKLLNQLNNYQFF